MSKANGLVRVLKSKQRFCFQWLSGITVFLLFCVSALSAFAPLPAWAQASGFVVVDYVPVSKVPAAGSGGSLYDYTYRVVVRNRGAAANPVVGSVASRRANVMVVDANVALGSMAAGQVKTSEDTFAVRSNAAFDRRLDQGPGSFQGPFGALLKALLDALQNLALNSVFTWNFRVTADTTVPTITDWKPQAWVNLAKPMVAASYSDDRGVDTRRTVFTLNGSDLVARSQVSATGIQYTPTGALAEGPHSVVLEVQDAAGNKARQAWTFRVDTVVPSISQTLPSDNATVGAQSTISGSFQDGGVSQSGIDTGKTRLMVNGVDVSAQAQISATGISYTPPAALPPGQQTVQLLVADLAGNVAQRNWVFLVAQPNQPPTVSLTAPAPNASFTAPAAITLSAAAADTDGSISRVEFFNGDVSLGSDDSAPFGLVWEGVAAGTYRLSARATDNQGASGTSGEVMITVVKPNQAPTVSLTAPAPNASFTAPAAITLSAAAADTDGSISRVEFFNGDVSLGSDDSAPFGLVWEGVAAGTYRLSARATDNQGAVGTSGEVMITVVKPNQAPTVSLTAPAPNASFTAPAAIALSAAAADTDGSISRVEFFNGDVSLGSDDSAPFGMVWEGVAAGTYHLSAKATDNQGAVGTSESLTAVVSAAPPPTLSVVSPMEGQVLPADALPLLQASYSAPTGVNPASVKVLLDGQDITASLGATAGGFSSALTQPLPEGAHSLEVSVANTQGAVSTKVIRFKTESLPQIAAQTPKDVFLPGNSQPVVFAAYSDVGSGIDPSQVKLSFRGADVTAQAEVLVDSVRYVVPQALPDGTHAVRLEVADKAGNRASSEWQFGTAQPPEISNTLPKDAVLPAGSRPTISASYQDSRVGIDTSKVRLFVNSDDVTAQAQVGVSGVNYTPAQALAEGPYTVYLEVANTTNAVSTAVWGFEVDAAKTYSVNITSPAGAQTVTNPKVTVTATAAANRSSPTRMTLGGRDMQVVDVDVSGSVRYIGEADLIDGTNTLQVIATFADGETRSASVEVSYDAPTRITLLSPADKAVLGPVSPGGNTPGGAVDLTGKVERPVTVTGQLSKPVVSVSINQQQATLGDGGRSFSFPNFFLREGTNMITAVATDSRGRVSSAAITVSVDQTAPILRPEAPLEGAITSANRIDVRGMVNDAVEGLIGAAEPTVNVVVNGQSASSRAAQVADRYFVAPDVPLLLGQNTIRITATDHVGNARVQDLQVTRIAVGSDRLTPLSGNRQTAAANTQLPQPLVVVALNPAGEPLPRLPISFDVLRGTGTISLTAGSATKVDGLSLPRNLTVTTDDFGRAQVWFTVGKQSGPGANEVRASHPALGEGVTFTANTLRGEPKRVNADTGKNQIAETNAQPLELISLVVRDELENPLPNVPVVFTIEEGDAVFPDVSGASASTNPNGPQPDKAAQRIVLATDKNGVTAVRPLMGNVPGTVRIRAQALKTEGGSIDNPADLIGDARFIVQVKQAQDGPALFSGQIFDDKSQPLAGVKVSIGRTSLVSTTDALGKFEISNVPPGRIDLFIDGRTYNPSNDPGKAQYPSLHFEAYAVKGQNNQLTQPIYLPPLAVNPESAKIVGGDQDVILTIPGLQGFQMKVKANSVTFPDGSKTGLLIVSPVTADKLPMAPPGGGSFGMPSWTVQPAGTRFDPPIEVTMPNNRAYRPGDNQPVVQWDHDLSQYVPMGRATVSEDGAVLVTDSGSGLTKAGWGALCVYEPDKCATPAPCDPAKCSISDGNCGCKDSPDKCKDGPKITGTWDVPKELFEGVSQKVSDFSKVNPWFELSASVTASGAFSASFQDKCCKGVLCSLPPKKSATVSGSIGANAKFEAKIGPALVGRIEEAVARLGNREVAGFVASVQVTDLRPSFGVKFAGSSVTASGTSDTCPDGSACIDVKFSSKLEMGGTWNPTVSAGVYIKKDSSLPALTPENKLNTANLQYFIEASAQGGGSVTASGYSVSVGGKFGDNCRETGLSSTITTGGIKAEYGYELSGKVLGIGSISFEWRDEVQLVEAVSQ